MFLRFIIVNLFILQSGSKQRFQVLVLCHTVQENHFLFSTQPHANVSPSLHFSLKFPTTDDFVRINTHADTTFFLCLLYE